MMLIFAYSITSTVSPGQAALSAGELDFTASSVTPAMTVREVELDPVEEGRLIAGAYDWRRLEFVFLQRRGIRTDLVSVQPSGAESRREAAPGASAGITYDFERARYVVLDSEGDGFAVFDPTAGAFDLSFEQTESLFSEAESGKSSNGEVTGGPFLEPGTALLDVDPYSGDLYVLSTDTSTISVYSPSGRLKDQQTVMVDDPIDFFVAPTSDTTDEPEDTTVFVLGDSTEGTTLFEAIGQRELQESAQAITSVSGPSSFFTDWSVASPDPMGLLLDPGGTELTIVDSEVNEISSLWLGWNVFISTSTGALVETSATTGFSNEPTGVTVDLATGLFYVTDDKADEVFVVDPGSDQKLGGGDDSVTSFDTGAFLSSDPEGVTFAPDLQALFVADAANREIYRIDAGPNGIFEGSGTDDTITSFDTDALGLSEPEGVAYIEETSSLLIVSQTEAAEVTVSGSLVRALDLSGFSPIQLSGVDTSAYDPVAGGWHVFVSDRAIDNNVDANENDGRVFSFLLSPANDAPTAVDDQTVAPSGGAVTIQVLSNDTDPDGNLDPGSLGIDCPSCQLPSYGDVTLNGDGTLDYTSTVTGVSSDAFIYEVCDSGFDNDPTTDQNDLCDVGSVTITIVGTSPPQAVEDTASTPEDTQVSIDVINNDYDADGDLDPQTLDVTCSGCIPPSLGTASVVGNEVSFVPAPNEWGLDSFEYEICDAAGLCDRALISVNITPVADAPTAMDDSFSTTVNTTATLDLIANDGDPDGDLDATMLNLDCGDCFGPAHGTATVNGDGTLTFEPASNYVGSDAVRYEVCDTTSRCSAATASITVSNNQPVTFSVIGDIPYSTGEISELQTHLDDHNLYSPSEFFVHLGDIKSGSSPCVRSWYEDVASQMSGLAVPTFIVPGDNEWADCDDPDLGWQYWTDNFLAFDTQFCASPQVWRQSIRTENFAFIQSGVLFIGINLIRGFVAAGEEAIRLQDDADWISEQVSTHGSSMRSVVVFAQAAPFTEPFASQFEATSASFGKPVLYLQGDGHSWIDDRPFVSTQNIRRIQVERGIAANPPIEVTATNSGPDAFTVDRDPWPTGTNELNRSPCVQAGADQTVQDVALLTALISDDGVPTPSTLSTTWSVTSGPGVVTFNDPNSPTTQAQFSLPGSYVLRLEASDGALTTSDSVTIMVTSSANPPTVTPKHSGFTPEGNTGSTVFHLPVELSEPSALEVTVDYATFDVPTGSTVAHPGSDYVETNGTLTFAPGETVQHIPIEVLGDTEDEPPLLWGEWGFVEFSNHSNGTPYTGSLFGFGIFVIIDDDTPGHGELASHSVRSALSAAG